MSFELEHVVRLVGTNSHASDGCIEISQDEDGLDLVVIKQVLEGRVEGRVVMTREWAAELRGALDTYLGLSTTPPRPQEEPK
jgi:hypothetical protein